MSLHEPLLPVDSRSASSFGCRCCCSLQNKLPTVTYRVVRILALCQAVLCSLCMCFLLLGWHDPCANASVGNSSNWLAVGRKVLSVHGGHLSCRQGLPQSVVLTLGAVKVCLLVLDVAGLALAVSLFQLYRPAGRLALLQDSEPVEQRVGKVTGSCTHDKSSCDDGDARGDSFCTGHCHEQLMQQSLMVSLSVWLAMLTTAGLVATLWL